MDSVLENIQIKLCTDSDLDSIEAMNFSYSTDYVWQMDRQEVENEMAVSFRQIRLPRTMPVAYHRNPQELIDIWANFTAIFLAFDIEKGVLGLISLEHDHGIDLLRIPDIIIANRFRRKGIGSLLLSSVEGWAIEQNIQSIMLEIQSKNFPAINFAKNLGFDFAGFNDNYFKNGDVALFFSKKLGN